MEMTHATLRLHGRYDVVFDAARLANGKYTWQNPRGSLAIEALSLEELVSLTHHKYGIYAKITTSETDRWKPF